MCRLAGPGLAQAEDTAGGGLRETHYPRPGVSLSGTASGDGGSAGLAVTRKRSRVSRPMITRTSANAIASPRRLSCDADSARSDTTSRHPMTVIKRRCGRCGCRNARVLVNLALPRRGVLLEGERLVSFGLSIEGMLVSVDRRRPRRIRYRTVRRGKSWVATD